MSILETERLVLTRLTEEDTGFLVELLNQPSFLQFIGDKGVRCDADALRYLQDGPDAMYQRYGFCLYRVALKETDTVIGMCGLLKREQLPDPDLGFAFLTAYEGKGYATEAARAVLNLGFNELGLARIVAIANSDNAGSHRLLKKIGLCYQGERKIYDDEAALAMFVIERPAIEKPAIDKH